VELPFFPDKDCATDAIARLTEFRRQAGAAFGREFRDARTKEGAERVAAESLERRLESKEDVPLIEDFPLAPEEETPDFKHHAGGQGGCSGGRTAYRCMNDLIVSIEAERQPLAQQDLVADIPIDELVELGGLRWLSELEEIRVGNMLALRRSDMDRITRSVLIPIVRATPDQQPERDEMQQRLARSEPEPPPQASAAGMSASRRPSPSVAVHRLAAPPVSYNGIAGRPNVCCCSP
jgi:hypothetical protein